MEAHEIGFSIFIVILGGYFLLRDFIDFHGIKGSMISNIGVNAENFLFVAVYIAFMNSLLEEFFVRGFSFVEKENHRLFAYICSASLFLLYHVGMMMEWFHLFIYLFARLGLFIDGCIFNYLNER